MRTGRAVVGAVGAGALAVAGLALAATPAVAVGGAPDPAPAPSAPAPRSAPTPPPVDHYRTALPVGPADTGPAVAAVQQRLIWLGEPVALTRVMDRATLISVSHVRTKYGFPAGTTVTAPVFSVLTAVSRAHGSLPASCRRTGLALCVDKTQKTLRLVRDGRVLLTTDARFGPDALPTREGVFRIYRKDATHVSTLYKTPMPYAMFFSGGQAVHYSPYFHRDGYSGHSHGCVNLRDLTVAKRLYAVAAVGTRVVVYRS